MNAVVHVIGPTFGVDLDFRKYGYDVFTDRNVEPRYVDIACFTGGADISPWIYGAEPEPFTRPQPERDKKEIEWYHAYKEIPKVGICRGGQLLNALNGGKMLQHVPHHAGAAHAIEDIFGEYVTVCSVHHQMMVPGKHAELISWAKGIAFRDGRKEPEVLWIPSDKALCFQAHPEFGPKSCTDYFFKLMDKYILPLLSTTETKGEA